jgi:hypothetical protein
LVDAGKCSIGRRSKLDECEKQKIGKLSRYFCDRVELGQGCDPKDDALI